MSTPIAKLMFIPNAYTPREGNLEEVARIALVPSTQFPGNWTMNSRQTVKFPTGDVVTVMCEVNPQCNYLHIYDGNRRIVSWKAAGDVDLMFLLPSGQEAYASLVAK